MLRLNRRDSSSEDGEEAAPLLDFDQLETDEEGTYISVDPSSHLIYVLAEIENTS